MSNGLLLGQDAQVAAWVHSTYRLFPMKYDMAVGIVSPEKILLGAFLLEHYNGVDVHLSYYGPGTPSLAIGRSIARIVALELNAARCTVVTSKRNKRLISKLIRLGFKMEGSQRRFYGHADNARNTAIRLVMFREGIDRWAGIKKC